MLVWVILFSSVARANPPSEGGSNDDHAPILIPGVGARDDDARRTLGFDLRTARPITSQVSWVAGVAGLLATERGGDGVHTIWQAVAGAGLDWHPSDRVTIGVLVGPAATDDGTITIGGEAHVDVKAAELRGQWLEVDAYVAHAAGVSGGVSAHYPF